MNADELMIGNIIISESSLTNWEVMPSDIERIFENEAHYRPVLITEKWLSNFGFVKDFDGFYRKNKSSMIEIFFSDNGLLVTNQSVCLSQIQYVHQLQNLYLALTSNPLQLVEPK